MKRYFLSAEFFGFRVYDSVKKKEYYFDKDKHSKVMELVGDDYTKIETVPKKKNISAPLKISMNITTHCNLGCKQCFTESGEKSEDELTTDEMKNLFNDMYDNGTFYICLGGGEPFMRNDLSEILEHSKEKQLATSIVSNGLLLDGEVVNDLNEKDLDMVWVSLDGLKENHEALRGKGTFQGALDAIKLLGQELNAKKAIRVSLNKFNITEYNGLIKIAEDANFDLIRFTPLLSYGRATDDLLISQEQYLQFLREIAEIKSKVKIVYPGMEHQKFWISNEDFGCHCGKEAIWIDEVGNYSPCFFLGEEANVGNIRNDSYAELWDKAIAISDYEPNDTCMNCKKYTTCRAGCRARVLKETGSLKGVDPLCALQRNLV